MNGFIDLVRKRKSIRGYRPDPVPRDMIEKCLEAARYAPSACNTQCCRFIVAEGDVKDRLATECLGELPVQNRWAVQAPVIVVIATARSLITHRLGAGIKGIQYDLIDAGIAGEHFILQATELGLGTCWIGWFKKKKVRDILDIPSGWHISSMITLGFPSESPADIDRAQISEFCQFKGGGK